TEPTNPTVCAKVQATKYLVMTNLVNLDPYNATAGSTGGTVGTLGATGGTDAEPSSSSSSYVADETLDNTAIQAALNACPAGESVELTVGSSGQNSFVISPMNLVGQKLTIDAGVELDGTLNRADYGGTNCGLVTTGSSSCTPLITGSGDGGGIYGLGVIN